MTEGLTREDVVRFGVRSMLHDPFLSETMAVMGLETLRDVVGRLFGDPPLSREEVQAAKEWVLAQAKEASWCA